MVFAAWRALTRNAPDVVVPVVLGSAGSARAAAVVLLGGLDGLALVVDGRLRVDRPGMGFAVMAFVVAAVLAAAHLVTPAATVTVAAGVFLERPVRAGRALRVALRRSRPLPGPGGGRHGRRDDPDRRRPAVRRLLTGRHHAFDHAGPAVPPDDRPPLLLPCHRPGDVLLQRCRTPGCADVDEVTVHGPPTGAGTDAIRPEQAPAAPATARRSSTTASGTLITLCPSTSRPVETDARACSCPASPSAATAEGTPVP